MLNRPLYLMLRKHFGEVRIRNENVKRVEERMPNGEVQVFERGENYAMCCPLCSDDHFRFSVSYQWLGKQPFSNKRTTWLANCYNEDCAVRSREFYEPLLEDLTAAQIGALNMTDVPAGQLPVLRERHAAKLPSGLVPIKDLPNDHPATLFLKRKYQLPVDYLNDAYGVRFAATVDEGCPRAHQRLIFPIFMDGQVFSWQGRAVNQDVQPRWFLPAGFVKCFYNQDMVSPQATPIIAEGIPAAIACGPRGIAIFGKDLNSLRAREFGDRWQSVLIATDPDTFVPDNRKGGGRRVHAHTLRDMLAPYVRTVKLIRWPADILELAQRHNNNETEVTVPDAADLGLRRMKEIIDASI